MGFAVAGEGFGDGDEVDGAADGGAAAEERQLVAVHVGQNPHVVEIRDSVELEAAIKPETGPRAMPTFDAGLRAKYMRAKCC